MLIGFRELGTEWAMTNKKSRREIFDFFDYLMAANTLSLGHFVVNIL